MNINELLSLNQTIFGTKLPKIRAMQGKLGITYNLTKTNAENIFFYFGENTNVDVYVGGDNIVHVKDYCNLQDVLDAVSYSSNQVHLEFKLVYPKHYISIASDVLPWTYDAKGGLIKLEDTPIQGVLPSLWDITDEIGYYSITGIISSNLRVYLLEYDQTKIMKL